MKHYRVLVFGLLLVLVAACVSIGVRPARTTRTPTPVVTAATGAAVTLTANKIAPSTATNRADLDRDAIAASAFLVDRP